MKHRFPGPFELGRAIPCAWLLLSCAWGLLAGTPGTNLFAADEAPVLYVHPDPAVGEDASGRGFDDAHPLRTFQFALGRAAVLVSEPGYAGIRGVTLRLAAGTYAFGPGGEGAAAGIQKLPVTVPAALELVRILGPGLPAMARLVASGEPGFAGFFELDPIPGSRAVTLEVSDLQLEGGFAGLLLQGLDSVDARITVTRCAFLGQRTSGVQLSARPGARVSVVVSGCTFRGGAGGVTAGAGEGGELRLRVEDCKLLDLRKYAPGVMLGAGVDVALEPASKAWVVVARCEHRGVASAVQLTEAEESPSRQPSGGELHALIVSNVVNGGPFPAPDFVQGPDVTNGIYLSLWPHHRNDIWIVNNTFVDVSRHVVFHDNLLALAELGLGLPPVTFANNIAVGAGGASELDEEVFAFGEAPPGEHFDASASIVESNLLEKSRHAVDGLDGNFSADPLFADAAAGDFRLRADSPAIDRGDPAFGGPFEQFDETSSLDFSGRLCRRAWTSCSLSAPRYPIDVGAHEREGFCDAEGVGFLRGDCNGTDGKPAISDAVFAFSYLFIGGSSPRCQDACDANDDGVLNISDGIFILSYLFVGGGQPPPPFDTRGTDPSRDCLRPCSG